MKQIKILKLLMLLTLLVTVVLTNSCSEDEEDTSIIRGTLTGVVTDQYQVTVDGVNISLSNMDKTSFSKDNGQYTLSNISIGEQTVTYTKTGYVTLHETIGLDDFDARNIVTLDVTMLKDVYELTGTISDSETSVPIQNVTVTYEAGTVTSDSKGSYLLEEIEKGEYTFEFSKEGYQTETRTLTLNESVDRTVILNIELSRNN